MCDIPAEQATIGPKMTVREVLTLYPEAEAVFDRHGLGGCGGPQGPVEPIGFFAVVHHVDPKVLVRELNEYVAGLRLPTAAQPAVPVPAPAEQAVAAVYPYFLIASTAIAVAAGFSLGLWALLAITSGVPTGGLSWMNLIQVHGQIQLWGFVGLFVMGVAYHAVPRFRSRALASNDRILALTSLSLLLTGVGLRAAQLALPASWPYPVLVLSAVLTLAGAGLFAWIMVRVLAGRGKPEGYEPYLLAGAGWLVAGALFNLGLLARLWWDAGVVVSAPMDEAFLAVLFFGYVLMMVLGVSARAVPVFFGLRPGRASLVRGAFWAINLGTTSLAAGLALPDANAAAPSLRVVGALLQLGGVLAFIIGLRLFEPKAMAVPELSSQGIPTSFQRFVRLAYVWLVVAVVLGAYFALAGAFTSKTFAMTEISAGRHAMALGFVTLVIIGMATRIIPVFGGTRLFSAGLQESAFWLVFASVTLRVVLELGFGYGTALDHLMATSGVLGFLGITLFAGNLWLTMAGKTLGKPQHEVKAAREGSAAFTADTPLATIAERVPGAVPVLAERGLSMLGDPEHRDAAVRTLTLGQAARMARVDVAPLVTMVNRLASGAGRQAEAAVTADMVVAEVLRRFPETLPVFVSHGFGPLADSALRARMAATVTVAQASRLRNVDLAALLEALNQAASASSNTKDKQRLSESRQ